MAAALALVPKNAAPDGSSAEDFSALIELVIPAIYNPLTRYRYKTVLTHFMQWMHENGMFFCRVSVQKYIAHKIANDGWSNNTVNQALSAIRHLAKESQEHGLLPDHLARRILTVKCMRSVARRKGKWLTKQQVSAILAGINLKKQEGLRDLVVLGLMVGAGLRRKEVCILKCDNVKLMGGRLGLYDVLGKGSKYRDVPLPAWLGAAIKEYQDNCGVRDGWLIRATCHGHIMPSKIKPINGGVVERIVKVRSQAAGFPVDPHDLRRTWAKLALAGGAKLEQISMSLGHSSIAITQRYLGVGVDMDNAACDAVGEF